MKRTGFKKKYKLTAFHLKPRKPMKQSKGLQKRSRLHLVGHSTTSELKTEIQAILRQIVIIRDRGCWLRNYPESGACSGYRNDGTLILQAEHLHTRARASSFSDSRLVVCICRHHHIHWKPQHSDLYNKLAKYFIGKERSDLWDRVRDDCKSYKVDLKLELLGLKKELSTLQGQIKGI